MGSKAENCNQRMEKQFLEEAEQSRGLPVNESMKVTCRDCGGKTWTGVQLITRGIPVVREQKGSCKLYGNESITNTTVRAWENKRKIGRFIEEEQAIARKRP